MPELGALFARLGCCRTSGGAPDVGWGGRKSVSFVPDRGVGLKALIMWFPNMQNISRDEISDNLC